MAQESQVMSGSDPVDVYKFHSSFRPLFFDAEDNGNDTECIAMF